LIRIRIQQLQTVKLSKKIFFSSLAEHVAFKGRLFNFKKLHLTEGQALPATFSFAKDRFKFVVEKDLTVTFNGTRVLEVHVKEPAAATEQHAVPDQPHAPFPQQLQDLQVFNLEGQVIEVLVNQGAAPLLGKGIRFFLNKFLVTCPH
jgi:hypothetical protein